MFYAARGEWIELIAGRRVAEDDEHTEVTYRVLSKVISETVRSN